MLTLLICIVIVSMIIYALNKEIGFIAMQTSLALFIVYATYWMSLWVLKRDKLVLDTKYNTISNTRTLIVDGYTDAFSLQNTVIDTLNPSSVSYANLPRSVNRMGGAQFTYQFWFLLTNTDKENVGSKDILVRGDIMPYRTVTVNNATNETTTYEGMIIKCPRIRFNGSFDDIAVEVNTLEDPIPPPMLIKNRNSDSDATSRRNILKLTKDKWVLYTFIFQDSVQVNDFENGVAMTFYVNDLLYQTTTMRSALKQNNGNLYLFPSGAIDGCKVGNLAYYNYALSLSEIAKIYNNGPPKVASAKKSGPVASPLFLTEYNKLDIYNT